MANGVCRDIALWKQVLSLEVRIKLSLTVRSKEIAHANKNSGVIYYTETYDKNMMGVCRIWVDLWYRAVRTRDDN
jgi:hypothetical protein